MWAYLAAGIFSAITAFYGAWQVQDWRYTAKDKARIEAEAKAKEENAVKQDKAAERHEATKEIIRTQFIPVIKEVERVIEKPIYRNVCLDSDGLRIIQNALGTANVDGQPAPAVPPAK